MLKAWWKLNGDLLDSSGNENHLSYINNTGVLTSINEGIVLPKAYQRTSHNSGNDLFRSKKKVNLSGEFTISCFVYAIAAATSANGVISNHDHTLNTGAGINLKYISNSDYRITINTGNGTNRTYEAYYGNTNIKNKWVNAVLRFKNGKVGIFVDGVLDINEFDYSMYCIDDFIDLFNWSTSYKDSNNYRGACKLQDVRIYDHALSDKEIKELAKAKILHLTFDDVEEPTVNLLNTLSISENIGLVSNTYNSIDDTRRLITSGDTTSTGHVSSRALLPIEYNNTYTLSYEYRHNDGKDTVSSDGISIHWTGGNAGFSKKYKLPDGWIKVELTVYVDSSLGYTNVNSGISVCYPSSVDITVRKFQAEKKDHSTPFVNGSRNTSIIYDKSDYGNHTTTDVATAPAFVEDCKVGRQSSKFDLLNKKLQLPSTILPILKNGTISFWRKRIRTGHCLFLSELYGSSPNNYYLMASTNGTGSFYGPTEPVKIYVNSIIRNSPLDSSEWVHYCATGVNLSAWINWYINSYDTNDEWNNHSIIDDFRVYATALSAEDVKEIYQTRASLDDKGNFTVVSLNQQDVTSTSLTEKGIYNTINFSEIGVAEGLIAHYPLNGDARDYSGNGNDGTVVGATVASGQGQKCYSFDGVNDKINTPFLQSQLNPLGFSVSVWLKCVAPTDGSNDGIFGCHDIFSKPFKGFGLQWNNGVLQPFYGTGAKWEAWGMFAGAAEDYSVWKQIVIVYEPTSKVTKYINGVMIKSVSTPGAVDFGLEQFMIGIANNGANRYLNGQIQDLRIYNRALTPEEIMINCNLTKADKTAMIQSENGTTYVSQINED